MPAPWYPWFGWMVLFLLQVWTLLVVCDILHGP